MEPRYCKALLVETKAQENNGQEQKVFRFRATTETEDRQREVVTVEGWQTENFKLNPVFMLAHRYDTLPIGRVVNLETDEDGLLADVVFDEQDETARMVQSKYERGYLNAVSVGFNSLEMDYGKGKEPLKHTRKELLEISAVAIPANPEALMVRMLKGLLDGEQITPEPVKMAHPPHTSPKADEGMAWDAAAELRQAEGESQLWQMHAWRDSEGDPEAKSSYKLPHHQASGEVVWRGVAAAMAALLGARGGTSLPESDSRATFNHLARHYSQFDKEPPEFKSAEELKLLGHDEIKGLFWEGELDEVNTETKAGRRNSAKDMAAMKEAMGHMEEAMRLMQSLMGDMGDEEAMPDEDHDEEHDDEKSFEIDLSALEALVKEG